MNVLPKQFKHLNSKEFLLGFEVECVFKLNKKEDEYAILKDLHKICSKIEVDDDGSIEPDDYENEHSAEIKTPPLHGAEAFELLNVVFKYVSEIGYTNSTCGLHLNFSPLSEKIYKSFNPFPFVLNPIWRTILKDFKRNNNSFCEIPSAKTHLELYRGLMGYYENMPYGKGACVNLDSYGNRKYKDSRVEIRGFGNKGYHKKISKIRNYSEKILDIYLKSCNS